jgi:excisionase family DNA binding protein
MPRTTLDARARRLLIGALATARGRDPKAWPTALADIEVALVIRAQSPSNGVTTVEIDPDPGHLRDMRPMSYGDAADHLGRSTSTIYRMVRDGLLPTVVVGRRKMIPAAAVYMIVDGGSL